MGWLLGAAFSSIMAFAGLVAFCMEQKVENLLVLIIFFLLDVLCFKKNRDIKSGVAAQKKQIKREKVEERKRIQKESRDVLKRTITAKHQAGLPLAQDATCAVVKEDDGFKISGGGNDYILKNMKITDICVKSDVEIQRQYVSSIGGAVGGAVVFGPLGAIVGGRAKKKKIKTKTYYLIFSYISDSEISYISFEITEHDQLRAAKWAEEFIKNNNNRERNTIETCYESSCY